MLFQTKAHSKTKPKIYFDSTSCLLNISVASSNVPHKQKTHGIIPAL